ncbi:MAG TPA: hypothetical protein VF556_13910 [Pyrinomonadaceae bacterium]|jgi:hypothetical protein
MKKYFLLIVFIFLSMCRASQSSSPLYIEFTLIPPQDEGGSDKMTDIAGLFPAQNQDNI